MKKHLKDHGDISYIQHLTLSWGFAFQCLRAAFYAFCHGIVPSSYAGKINAAATIRKLISSYDQESS